MSHCRVSRFMSHFTKRAACLALGDSETRVSRFMSRFRTRTCPVAPPGDGLALGDSETRVSRLMSHFTQRAACLALGDSKNRASCFISRYRKQAACHIGGQAGVNFAISLQSLHRFAQFNHFGCFFDKECKRFAVFFDSRVNFYSRFLAHV